MRRVRLLHLPQPLHTTAAWILGMLALLAACGDNAESLPSQTQVTDSAGVAIVTNPSGDAVYATIALEPVLSIGAIDGPAEVLFGRIASVAVDRTGNLIVADGQMGEIRIFDASGTHLRTIGGPGRGRASSGRSREPGPRRRAPSSPWTGASTASPASARTVNC